MEKEKNYEAPSVQSLEIVMETGFATSGGTDYGARNTAGSEILEDAPHSF